MGNNLSPEIVLSHCKNTAEKKKKVGRRKTEIVNVLYSAHVSCAHFSVLTFLLCDAVLCWKNKKQQQQTDRL